MFVLMTYTPWRALQLTPANFAMPPPVIAGGEDGMIGFLPVYATRAAAEAASGGHPELVREIQERQP